VRLLYVDVPSPLPFPCNYRNLANTGGVGELDEHNQVTLLNLQFRYFYINFTILYLMSLMNIEFIHVNRVLTASKKS